MSPFLILFLLIMIPFASAGFWEDLDNTTFVDNATEPQPLNLTPVVNVSQHALLDKEGRYWGILAGWVDIVGFKNVARIDGIDYINGNITESIIVQSDAWYSFSERCKQCRFDSIYRNISIRQGESNVTAWLNVTFKWHEFWWFCSEDSCYGVTVNHTDFLNISDSARAPKRYDADLSNISVNIIEYNNTVSSKTTIEISPITNISKIEIQYNGSSIIHRFALAAVEYNNDGVPYANYSRLPGWNNTGNELSHFGDLVVISSADVDYSKLKVYVSSPFETIQINNYSIKRINWKPTDTWNPYLFYYWSIIITLVAGIYFRVRLSL